MKRALSLMAAALAAACAVATEPGTGGVDADVQVRLGQQVTLDEGRLVVGFTEVPADSRCPVDVQCVQAGEATVALSVTAAGREPAVLTLRTTVGKDAATYGAYRIELRSLLPQPRQAGGPAETPYVTLHVRGES
ncbi:MAG TPA: hypothetical protein VHG51_08185 [Longimicrobiaceae bacterium]|nr:hypothetical protein [Longimicrobiaceae bacterium]